MTDDSEDPPLQEISHSNERVVPNPVYAGNIMVSMPETMEIKLVDASALAEYEVWMLLSSIGASAVIGYSVATVQAPAAETTRYLFTTFVFGLITFVFIFTAAWKRRRLRSKAKSVRFKLGEIVEDSR